MAKKDIHVKNANRVRKWGWGYSTAFVNRDGRDVLENPVPEHTGTLGQVQKAIENDRTYATIKNNTRHKTAWFYDGDRIVGFRDNAGKVMPLFYWDWKMDGGEITLVVEVNDDNDK